MSLHHGLVKRLQSESRLSQTSSRIRIRDQKLAISSSQSPDSRGAPVTSASVSDLSPWHLHGMGRSGVMLGMPLQFWLRTCGMQLLSPPSATIEFETHVTRGQLPAPYSPEILKKTNSLVQLPRSDVQFVIRKIWSFLFPTIKIQIIFLKSSRTWRHYPPQTTISTNLFRK